MGFRGTNVAVPWNVPDGNPGRELFKVLRNFQVPIRFRKMLPTFVNSAMFAIVSDEVLRVLNLYGTSGSADDAGPAGDFGDLRFAEDARSSRPPRANAIPPPPDFLVAPILRPLAASGLRTMQQGPKCET